MNKILLCWLGRTDLRAVNESDQVGIGPIAQALHTGRFCRLELLCDYATALVDDYLNWLRSRTDSEIRTHQVTLSSPTDFDAIYRHARALAASVSEQIRAEDGDLTYHLSPGTPAMAAVWIILAKTRFPAELIESSIQHGVRTVSVPFQIAADFIPDLLRRPDADLARLAAGLPPPTPAFEDIVHQSPVMQRVVVRARRIALRSIPVLIEGESGTGKELFARAIHQASPRRDHPFIAINCGAIPEQLLESELFGHSKGAFTGALRDHRGLFQSADGGTLFLDEIGDMPMPLQVKLLRALQERTIRPVGSSASIPVDVRVISATHRNLAEEMKAGRFREDLYYRINVVGLELPALAARREDISLLANSFLHRLSEKYGKRLNGFAPEAMELLIAAPWPGNVRQLQNIVEQTVVLSTTSLVPASLVQKALHDDIGGILPFETARKNFERDYLIKLLKATNGSVTQAARLAQRNRTEFYKLLQRHELTPALFKENTTSS